MKTTIKYSRQKGMFWVYLGAKLVGVAWTLDKAKEIARHYR